MMKETIVLQKIHDKKSLLPATCSAKYSQCKLVAIIYKNVKRHFCHFLDLCQESTIYAQVVAPEPLYCGTGSTRQQIVIEPLPLMCVCCHHHSLLPAKR